MKVLIESMTLKFMQRDGSGLTRVSLFISPYAKSKARYYRAHNGASISRVIKLKIHDKLRRKLISTPTALPPAVKRAAEVSFAGECRCPKSRRQRWYEFADADAVLVVGQVMSR